LDEYLGHISNAGLTNVSVDKKTLVTLPDEILSQYLDAKGIEDYKNSGMGIYSVTVSGDKPECEPGSGCCC